MPSVVAAHRTTTLGAPYGEMNKNGHIRRRLEALSASTISLVTQNNNSVFDFSERELTVGGSCGGDGAFQRTVPHEIRPRSDAAGVHASRPPVLLHQTVASVGDWQNGQQRMRINSAKRFLVNLHTSGHLR